MKIPCYGARVPVNSTHPDYDTYATAWLRARDVFAGEDAVKSGGERYLPKLDSQTPDEYNAYRARASFFNATARTVDGFVGLIFRRESTVKLPDGGSGVGKALDAFVNDADMLGTPLESYAKNVVSEVMGVGRAGTLVDWEDQVEQRAYAVLYTAEQIINWRTERVNGRNVLTLLVLRETSQSEEDPFVVKDIEQLRVLRLVLGVNTSSEKIPGWAYQVEVWQRREGKTKRTKPEWVKVETRIPLRLGKPLPLIPFVFHGPRNSLPCVDKLPLGDIIGQPRSLPA
jgi:hypothetical protein